MNEPSVWAAGFVFGIVRNWKQILLLMLAKNDFRKFEILSISVILESDFFQVIFVNCELWYFCFNK